MPEVREERTGWRDSKLSERHRKWGWNLPIVDIDFLVIEYDNGKAVALVEYKHEIAPLQYVRNTSYQAMIDLGNRASIPVFACRYNSDFNWWKVIPLNLIAKKLTNRKEMNEKEWVTFLYKIRGKDLPKHIFNTEGILI